MSEEKSKQKKTVFMLVGMVVAFFAVAFAMVPLYGLLCKATGVNSISSGTAGRVTVEEAKKSVVDENREIIVEFDASVYDGMPWEFRALTHRMKVHPGKMYHASFYAKNNSNRDIVGQAIPGITPWEATGFFHKTECFCFTQQPLKAGEGKKMDLVFVVDSALPKKYSTLTLSYAFMDTANGIKQAPPLEHEPVKVSKLKQ